MKRKKILLSLLCLAMLLVFAGCHNRYDDLELFQGDGTSYIGYYQVGEKVRVWAELEGEDYTDDIDIIITEDETKHASIQKTENGYEVTSTRSGQVTVETDGKYWSRVYIVFSDPRDEMTISLSPQSQTVWQGSELDLSVTASLPDFALNPAALHYEITDNSAGATLNGTTLYSSGYGSVTVKATYTLDYNWTLTAQQTYTFNKISLEIKYPNASVATGKKFYVDYSPAQVNNEWISCEITEGVATVGKDQNGIYILSNETGVVEYALHIDNGKDMKQSAFGTVRFGAPKIAINSAIGSGYYAGRTIQLSAIGEYFDYFDESKVRYEVVSGNASISGNMLTLGASGCVAVRAVYTDGGVAYYSEPYEITARPNTLSISANKGQTYLNEKVLLSASSTNIEDFDSTAVKYEVLEGKATIVDGVLVAEDVGDIRVQASYTYLGEVVKSNVMVIVASYDGSTIANAWQLKLLNNSDGTFYVTKDIDLSGYENWEPIRNFSGTLHGNGHTISGLNITASNLESEKGLFATLSGTVENLNVDGTIKANGEVQYIGLLCGKNTGTIKNVTTSGTVTAQYSTYVGGIAGWSDNSYILNCTNCATVLGQNRVGGLAGEMNATRSNDVLLKNNKNCGDITGESSVGGLYGVLKAKSGDMSVTILVQNCTNEGAVNATKDAVGGLIGHARGEYHNNGENRWSSSYREYTAYIKITSCENTATVNGNSYVGGMVGWAEKYVSEISFCENTGDITGSLYVGGYAGRADGTAMRSLTNSNTITGKAWVGGIAGYAGKLEKCVNSGNISTVKCYVDSSNNALSYVGGIAGFATSANNCTNNSDITVTDAGYYVGGIAGYASASRSGDENLFADNKNYGAITSDNAYVGGIYGKFASQGNDNDVTIVIKNNTNSGAIVGTDYVGGLIGHARGEYHNNGENRWSSSYREYTAYIKITSCENTATVNGNSYVGGMVGWAEKYVSEISFCENTGDITGSLYVGGYAGRADGTAMRSLTNSNTITGKAWVGGIAGYAGKLEKCVNSGNISTVKCYVDSSNNALSYVGGIAGFATSANNCTNNSDITVTDAGYYVGGIAGYASASRSGDENLFADNKNYGAITSDNAYVGGIYGKFASQGNDNDVTIVIKNNTNSGAIVGTDYVGGLIGHARGEYHNNGENRWSSSYREYTAYVKIMDCTNDANVTGNDYVGGILGCGEKYMITDEVVWNTNTFAGTLTADGDNQGDYYG